MSETRVTRRTAEKEPPTLELVLKRNSVERIKRAGGKALAQTADIADERQVQELALATARWVGPASILVNCAGMVDPMAPLARSDAALWLRNRRECRRKLPAALGFRRRDSAGRPTPDRRAWSGSRGWRAR